MNLVFTVENKIFIAILKFIILRKQDFVAALVSLYTAQNVLKMDVITK